MKVEAVTEIPGLGYSATTVYYAMKVEENPLSDAVKSAWQTRSTKTYLLISEDLHSQIYEMILPIAPVPLSSFAEGYVNAHQIVDENRAVAIRADSGQRQPEISLTIHSSLRMVLSIFKELGIYMSVRTAR